MCEMGYVLAHKGQKFLNVSCTLAFFLLALLSGDEMLVSSKERLLVDKEKRKSDADRSRKTPGAEADLRGSTSSTDHPRHNSRLRVEAKGDFRTGMAIWKLA